MHNPPLWSILIPSISPRLGRFGISLVENLEAQIGDLPIELLVLHDNKRRSIGGKRNSLLAIARGEYISFIDDDDIVSTDYISTIYNTLQEHRGVDVITFDYIRKIHLGNNLICRCRFGVEPPGFADPEDSRAWVGPPTHLMLWKYDIAIKAHFPLKDYREDFEWMIEVGKHVRTSANIGKILYCYQMGRAVIPDEILAQAGDPFCGI